MGQPSVKSSGQEKRKLSRCEQHTIPQLSPKSPQPLLDTEEAYITKSVLDASACYFLLIQAIATLIVLLFKAMFQVLRVSFSNLHLRHFYCTPAPAIWLIMKISKIHARTGLPQEIKKKEREGLNYTTFINITSSNGSTERTK